MHLFYRTDKCETIRYGEEHYNENLLHWYAKNIQHNTEYTIQQILNT